MIQTTKSEANEKIYKLDDVMKLAKLNNHEYPFSFFFFFFVFRIYIFKKQGKKNNKTTQVRAAFCFHIKISFR
jgi:hypothetical protein